MLARALAMPNNEALLQTTTGARTHTASFESSEGKRLDLKMSQTGYCVASRAPRTDAE